MKKIEKLLFLFIMLFGLLNTSSKAQSDILAPTPPMGWMSWYTFIDNINEELIMEVADAMVNSGLRDAGYNILQLDDGWMAMERDEENRQFADKERFPRGMKFLGDYLHDRGLKLGIYSSAGTETCEKYPGSFGYEEIDAETYAAWGVDYLKYDACGEKEGHSDKELYQKMSKALKATGRPILYEVCIYYTDDSHLWAGEFGDMWRTGGDIVKYIKTRPEVTWENWYENLNQVVGKEEHAVDGNWNDPDNIIVGYPRNNKQTWEEQKAQFSFWSLIAAPMILSADVRNLTPEIETIILNKDVIAISQDKAGIQGKRIKSDVDHEVWVKHLEDGSKAVILFNKKDIDAELSFSLSDINEGGKYYVRDLWEHANKGRIKDSYSSNVAPHGVVMIKISENK